MPKKRKKINKLLHRRQDLGMLGHAKVVIRTPNSNLFLFLCRVAARKLFSESIDIVEVAIRLVLVFLVKLGAIKRLVVEWTSRKETRGFSR